MSLIAFQKPLVAVLEDHDDTRELLRIVLGDEFSVRDFQDAGKLLAALEREYFSAVVADIMLPGLDGYDFVRTVRSDHRLKDLPVVAVSALAMPADREKGLAAGFTEYLTKPISPMEISSVLWRYLKSDSLDNRAAS